MEEAWRELLTRVEVPSHYDVPEYFHDPLRRGERFFAILALEQTVQRLKKKWPQTAVAS